MYRIGRKPSLMSPMKKTLLLTFCWVGGFWLLLFGCLQVGFLTRRKQLMCGLLLALFFAAFVFHVVLLVKVENKRLSALICPLCAAGALLAGRTYLSIIDFPRYLSRIEVLVLFWFFGGALIAVDLIYLLYSLLSLFINKRIERRRIKFLEKYTLEHEIEPQDGGS